VNSALHPSGVAKLSTSFGWGKGKRVMAAGRQVIVCHAIWHVISHSSVMIRMNLLCMLYFRSLYFTTLDLYSNVLSLQQLLRHSMKTCLRHETAALADCKSLASTATSTSAEMSWRWHCTDDIARKKRRPIWNYTIWQTACSLNTHSFLVQLNVVDNKPCSLYNHKTTHTTETNSICPIVQTLLGSFFVCSYDAELCNNLSVHGKCF